MAIKKREREEEKKRKEKKERKKERKKTLDVLLHDTLEMGLSLVRL